MPELDEAKAPEASPASTEEKVTEGLKSGESDIKPEDASNAEGTKPVSKDTEDSIQSGKETRRDARINQLWKENKIKEEELKRIKQENEKLKIQVSQVQAPPKPVRAQYETEEQFLDAYDKYLDGRIEQKVSERTQHIDAVRVQAEENQAWQQFDQLAQKLDPEVYSDFDEVLTKSSKLEMSGYQREFFRTSKYGPQVFYHLAKNPELMDRIARMPMEQQTDALIDIRKQVVKASETKKVSEAPPPITPIGGDRAAITKDPMKMTDEEFARWRQQGKLKYKNVK